MSDSLRAYKKASDLPFSRLVKGMAGLALMPLFKSRSEAILKAPFQHPLSRTGRLIRNGHLLRAVARRDHGLIRDFFADFWASKASDEFYDKLFHRYESLFLKYHSGIVQETVKAVHACEGACQRMVEIGSGDGKILEHFSRHLPEIAAFHGVDLNLEQVEKCRLTHREDPRMAFHHEDASGWLERNRCRGTILVANGGVLEYFTREELQVLFTRLAEDGPCVVSITESIAADHDLAGDPKTHPYGNELSLSHNYGAILTEAGFEIDYTYDRLTTPEESKTLARWIQIVAHRH